MTGTGLSLGNHTSFFFDRNLKTSPWIQSTDPNVFEVFEHPPSLKANGPGIASFTIKAGNETHTETVEVLPALSSPACDSDGYYVRPHKVESVDTFYHATKCGTPTECCKTSGSEGCDAITGSCAEIRKRNERMSRN